MSRGGGTEEGRPGACTYKECQPYHDASRLGVADVKSCNSAVDVIEKAEHEAESARKKEEEARKKEEEARKKEAAKSRDEALKRDRENEAKRKETARKADDRRKAEHAEAAEQRQKNRDEAVRERKTEADDRKEALKSAHELQHLERKAAEAAAADREKEAADIAAKQGKNASSLAEMVDKASDAIGAAAKGIKDAVNGIGTKPSGESTSLSDFDLPSSSTDRYKSFVDNVFEKSAGFVPFAGIPLSLVKNALFQTADMGDLATRAIRNFESMDSRELDEAFNAFPQKVLGIKPFMKALINSGSDQVSAYVEAEYIKPAVEEAFIALRLSQSDGSARSLFSTPPRTTEPQIVFWWEGKAASTPSVVRDGSGTPLLYDRGGRLFQYDAAAGRARYGAGEVEKLVSRTDATPRYEKPFVWTRKSAVTFPPVRDGTGNQYTDWVAGAISEWAMAQSRDQWNAAVDRVLDKVTPKP